ncbi:MAG: hypothetical protein INR65_06135 [Gluconacetobacter diazotrophicus]|nr:hypothetical protein [Gluconacetobacter diazotrophicus]
MPIWPVSFVDGVYQVADADGVNYPLTMERVPLTSFNPGWEPRGLHTGLPPFHVLELQHAEAGETAIWLLDSMLNYCANAVLGLHAPEQAEYFAVLEPLTREIFEQSVRSRHAAVPAAAHHFADFLPRSTRALLADPVARAIPRPEVVRPDAFRDLGSYTRDGVTLTAEFVDEAMARTVPDAGSSGAAPGAAEVLDLGGHRALRRFDERAGVTSYLLQGSTPEDRHLYVPAAGVVFSEADHVPEAVLPLVLWYATHTDRAVALPEMEELGLGIVEPPPGHGMAEHATNDVVPAETLVPGISPGGMAAAARHAAEAETASAVGHRADVDPEGAHPTEPYPAEPYPPEPHSPELRSAELPPADGHDAPAHADEPVGTGQAEAVEPPASWNGNRGTGWDAPNRDREPAAGIALAGAPPAATEPPRQNWWQRLLGLGNP